MLGDYIGTHLLTERIVAESSSHICKFKKYLDYNPTNVYRPLRMVTESVLSVNTTASTDSKLYNGYATMSFVIVLLFVYVIFGILAVYIVRARYFKKIEIQKGDRENEGLVSKYSECEGESESPTTHSGSSANPSEGIQGHNSQFPLNGNQESDMLVLDTDSYSRRFPAEPTAVIVDSQRDSGKHRTKSGMELPKLHKL